MTKPADSKGADAKEVFERLDEIASGGGAQARFWRVNGRCVAKKARGKTLGLDDHLEFALAAYDAGRLPAEAVTCLALSLIDWQDVQPRVQEAYGRDFHDRYEAIRQGDIERRLAELEAIIKNQPTPSTDFDLHDDTEDPAPAAWKEEVA